MDHDIEHRLFDRDSTAIVAALKGLKGELSGDPLAWVSSLKMFHEDAAVRKVAKAALVAHAPEPFADRVKSDRRNYPAIEDGRKLLKVARELEATFGIDGAAFARAMLRVKMLHTGFGAELGPPTAPVVFAALELVDDPRTVFGELAHLEEIELEVKGSLPAGMSELTSMKRLRLEGRLKKATNIEELASLPNLLTISYLVAKADLSLLRPIKDRIEGLVFNAGHSELTDIGELEGFSELSRLDISVTGVTDLSPIAGKPIEWLNLRELRATDYEPLRSLDKLEHLLLTRNPMSEPDVIGDLPELESLSISFVEGFDLECLRRLRKLERVELWGYDFADISALRETSARHLRFVHCRVADISPLAEIPTLESVTVNTADLPGRFTIDDLKRVRPDLTVL